MLVGNQHYRTIWLNEDDNHIVQIIDQRSLPHNFVIENITSVDQMVAAIRDMHVRGAGLIGAAAGYGMYLGTLEARHASEFNDSIQDASRKLLATRPTAVNLSWAIQRQLDALRKENPIDHRIQIALQTAQTIADEDVAQCRAIGESGLPLLREIARKKNGSPVQILTHCNAGWLAFVDYGSAIAPVYKAFKAGIDLHVWVDETRPRNQGARLTAWELAQHNIPHTVITDNAGGHLMQQGLVDIVITGTDRTTVDGDVANKIGTYLKALAAQDNDVPFYVAVPEASFDWIGSSESIPIEQRHGDEVRFMQGLHNGELTQVLLTPESSPAANYAFDITPARLVTGLITARGICQANRQSILNLFPGTQDQL